MPQDNRPSEREFIALIAMMMALSALSIDAILPALPDIAQAFGVTTGNTTQQVIAVLFLGLTIGQLIYGPVSERFPRRPALALGIMIFMAGSLTSILATSFEAMLIGRFVQGFGIAALGILPLAIVRDQYEGPAMVRIMSLAVAVFILAPCAAPLTGQAVLLVADWRMIFWFLFLMSAEQIFHNIYQTGDFLALYFAIAAISIGAANVVNAQIVVKVGMQRISRFALVGAISLSRLAGTL